MARQNTKLESEGAEFLVLGHLLIEGVACYKAYVNFPGYDLIASNVETGKMARIQVKSRRATSYDKSFPIKNYNCDFVVHVALNRGFSFGRLATKFNTGIKEPGYYIFPVEVVKAIRNEKSKWGKTHIRKISNLDYYLNNWKIIKEYLSHNNP